MGLFDFLRRETPGGFQTDQNQTSVSLFWENLWGTSAAYNPGLLNRVWAANRCIQLNSQQVASMPLRFFGTWQTPPAWVSSPDPNWFPNGIGDAVFAATWSQYGWGDAFLLVTSRYASGFPSAWTVLNPESVSVALVNGKRQYKLLEEELDPADVVQISRDPGFGLRGTPALRSFGPHLWGSLASSELAQALNQGGVPSAVLKSTRKLTQEQAQSLQTEWVNASSIRRGAPAVLPPEIDFEQLAFSPSDLLLLDSQQYDARVIAAAFGVPPFLLNLPLEGGLTYQSPEMLFEVWWRTELRPAALRLSRALTANMLPRGNWVEFDARDVLAPDFSDLVASWEKIIGFGGATTDEFRASVLRLPPQSEQASLDDLLEPPVAATSAAQQNGNVTPLPSLSEVIT